MPKYVRGKGTAYVYKVTTVEDGKIYIGISMHKLDQFRWGLLSSYTGFGKMLQEKYQKKDTKDWVKFDIVDQFDFAGPKQYAALSNEIKNKWVSHLDCKYPKGHNKIITRNYRDRG